MFNNVDTVSIVVYVCMHDEQHVGIRVKASDAVLIIYNIKIF